MQFNLTYWQPTKYAAVIDQAKAVLALTDYISSEPQEADAERAARAIVALSKDEVPEDLDIVAIALECYGTEMVPGTEPADFGIAAGYQAEVRQPGAFGEEHSTRPMDSHQAAMARMVNGALTYYKPARGGPDGTEPWRRADRAHLAEALAVHITAGMAPEMDRRVNECVMGTLAELQRPRDIYMRPRDPREERRLFWVPDQAAHARAVEKLAECAVPERLCVFISLVQPGKEFEVWRPGQEIITVRPVTLLASRDDRGPGLAFSAARKRAFEIAYTVLNGEPGTVGAAVVLPDGQLQVFECGRGGELGTREVQLEEVRS